jgi:hypothetical protein
MVLREEHALTRAILALISLLYTPSAVTEQSWSGWQAWMVGQPCSTKTDILEGTCSIEIHKPHWMTKQEKRSAKFSTHNRR